MDARLIGTFRQFQRIVTSEVGALHDDFLGRGRAFGASRTLWEMGDGPVEVAALRERLGLDAGYASRMLGVLEGEGLVSIGPSPDDARAKVVSRTEAGRAEARMLDALSDRAAEDLLAHLSQPELDELDRATRIVTRTLARRHLTLDIEDAASRDALWCVGEFFKEIDALFEAGYDPTKALAVGTADLTAPHGAFVVARLHGEPIGCGGVKLPPGEPAFLKRMWVAPSARGLGVAGLMLDRLEGVARDAGATAITLDTNSLLTAAGRMYASRGYRLVPDFNGEKHADRWYRKDW